VSGGNWAQAARIALLVVVFAFVAIIAVSLVINALVR
jgi:hypothetical protein